MSTKTIYKRIALVAVAALGAGVLSVAPANAGNNAAAGGSNVATAAGVLNIAVEASITGAAVLGSSGAASGTTSAGLLANSTTQTTASLTSTATISSTGEAAFYYTAATSGAAVTVVVDGGSVSGHTVSAGSANYNSGKSTAVFGPATGAALVLAFSVKPASAATTTTVSLYETAAAAANNGSAADLVAIQGGAVSTGPLKQRYTVTVAATSQSGVYSASNSAVRAVLVGSASATETSNIDETGATSIANAASSIAFVNVALRDAYKVAIDSGALIINATNGALLAWNASGGSSSSGFNLVAVATDTTGTLTVARPTASANKGFSTTVTITHNGAAVGTKTITFQGEVATVTASAPAIGALSVSSTSAFRLAYADSAGTALYPTITDTSAISSTLTSSVTGLAVGTIGSSTALARGTLTCGSSAGSADVQVQHVNPLSGTVVKSNVWKATCAGDAASYTASWDKASYTPGSIATLSITFKDSKGNLANAYTAVSTTANLITITGGPSATAVTAPANGDAADSADGIKRYQFVVGTTTGDFSAVVSVPVVNTAAPTTAANQTVGYKVANATTGTTNEDVLKAIVSLIASINKQIAALQKALLRR